MPSELVEIGCGQQDVNGVYAWKVIEGLSHSLCSYELVDAGKFSGCGMNCVNVAYFVVSPDLDCPFNEEVINAYPLVDQ